MTAQTVFSLGGGFGMLLGGVVSLLQRHPTRRRFWVPVGFLSLLTANLLALAGAEAWWIGILAGGGLVTGSVGPPRRPGEILVLAAAGLEFLYLLARDWPEPLVFVVMAAICGILFAESLWSYRRPVGETLGEWFFRVLYRMRAMGPGVDQLPRTGPVLVISNHTAYLDPCWVMICLPRDLTPIMYGGYFKMFGLHFYMKQIINAIPSGVGTIRRETPELDEAVRRLDLGEGLLIFPEGWVRRKDEEPIRRFAQGAWRVLRDRPATPVVACWIEGGWGSWTSFRNGPPFKNKPIDVRRPITIAVAAPVVLDSAILADQHKTREYLRELVLSARRHQAACDYAEDASR